jgi:hypothetical protein
MRASIVIVVLALGFAAGCGPSKSDVFAALGKHQVEYGRCELMAQSKDPASGKPGWIGATICRAKLRKTVLTEVGETKKYEAWLEEWKKENGAKAMQAAKAAPAPMAKENPACPHGAGCINRCRAECEGKHGKIIDLAALRACNQDKTAKPETCVGRSTNTAAQQCLMKCRGL